MYRKSQTTGFPSLITIFSAPNYLDVYNNKGLHVLLFARVCCCCWLPLPLKNISGIYTDLWATNFLVSGRFSPFHIWLKLLFYRFKVSFPQILGCTFILSIGWPPSNTVMGHCCFKAQKLYLLGVAVGLVDFYWSCWLVGWLFGWLDGWWESIWEAWVYGFNELKYKKIFLLF